jgi:hypothetical protein
MPTPTTTIFGTFPTVARPGTEVQIQEKLLADAASGALGLVNGYQGTMRVYNLKQLYGYKYDFHLSFKLDETGHWAFGTHFCARDEGVGKNACAYWFYNLVRPNGAHNLVWYYAGTAPDNPLYATFIDAISVTAPGNSPTALRMASRRAAAPLEKLLTKFESLIAQNRAAVVTDKYSTKLKYLKS